MNEESIEPQDTSRFWWADRWLALLPLAVMTWTIHDVVTHEFNKWTMLRTVLLVVFSVPAMIGALLGGAIGFRVGSTIGLAFVLMGLMVGMMVIRIFFCVSSIGRRRIRTILEGSQPLAPGRAAHPG